jgi:hypothetical protein
VHRWSYYYGHYIIYYAPVLTVLSPYSLANTCFVVRQVATATIDARLVRHATLHASRLTDRLQAVDPGQWKRSMLSGVAPDRVRERLCASSPTQRRGTAVPQQTESASEPAGLKHSAEHFSGDWSPGEGFGFCAQRPVPCGSLRLRSGGRGDEIADRSVVRKGASGSPLNCQLSDLPLSKRGTKRRPATIVQAVKR